MNTLTIGVTGHRDIKGSAMDNVVEKTELFFKSIKQNYFDFRIILKSPLAEGADRLAAHEAIKLGIELVVPLPLEKAEYIHDFDTETSIQEFEMLCAKARDVYVVNQGKASRPACYYQVGCYVALTSDILLALWDQKVNVKKSGGTAHIVQEQFLGFPKLITSSYSSKLDRQTYVIHTPRHQATSPEIKEGFWTKKDYLQRSQHKGNEDFE